MVQASSSKTVTKALLAEAIPYAKKIVEGINAA